MTKIPFTKVGGIFTSYFLPLHSYFKIKFTRDFWKVIGKRYEVISKVAFRRDGRRFVFGVEKYSKVCYNKPRKAVEICS